MKSILAAVPLILSSLLALQVSAAPPIRATLMLPYDHVLPGIPFDMVVTYTNVSDRPLSIGGAVATLVVTFPSGETSVMHTPEANDQWGLGDIQQPVRIAPGQSAQYPVSWESPPNWSRYPSFSGPGTYGIALDLQFSSEDKEPVASVRTAAVTLTRIEPVGIDAELWKRMQEISNGQWTDDSFMATKPGTALADEIVQLHPESVYYPYILASRALQWPSKQHIRIPALTEAAERFQGSPAYPYLLKAAGDLAFSAATKATRARDAIEAEKYFGLAQQYYRDALATKSIMIRADAEQGLRDVTRDWARATKQVH